MPDGNSTCVEPDDRDKAQKRWRQFVAARETYEEVVILQEDQIELIAKRVIELLDERDAR